MKTEKLLLYHGTPDKVVHPRYGSGDEKHDYGKGFYLTDNSDLAKEWAVCRPNETNGWLHKYELDIAELKILDFEPLGVLSWLAELMKHRDAASSKRYRMLAEKFIAKYGIDTRDYDVIKGWKNSFLWEVSEFSIVSSRSLLIQSCMKYLEVLQLSIMLNSTRNIINVMFRPEKR